MFGAVASTIVLVTQTYTLLYPTDLLNVFETFLPQLLLYPNPTDPLNGEAAALLMREPESYNKKVRGVNELICVRASSIEYTTRAHNRLRAAVCQARGHRSGWRWCTCRAKRG